MQMRHFRYFIAAAEAGSFLKASSRLRVAQPSLSRQMRDLEREVGAVLFDRLPRGVRLTPAGEAFLIEARNTIECARRAVATARLEGAADRMLRVGYDSLFYCSRTVSKLLAAFRNAYPQTKMTIMRLNETKQRAALRERRIDVAIEFICTPTVAGFTTYHLMDVEITGVVIPASHPLADEDQISLADLRELTWLRVSRKAAPDLYKTLNAALASRGLDPVRERTRPRDPAIAGMHVGAGGAWMFTTESIGRKYEESNGAIVYRPFIEPPIPCWLGMLSCVDNPPPTVERLVAVAEETLAGQQAVGSSVGNAY